MSQDFQILKIGMKNMMMIGKRMLSKKIKLKTKEILYPGLKLITQTKSLVSHKLTIKINKN